MLLTAYPTIDKGPESGGSGELVVSTTAQSGGSGELVVSTTAQSGGSGQLVVSTTVTVTLVVSGIIAGIILVFSIKCYQKRRIKTKM